MAGIIARAETDIAAPPERVWEAMTDPKLIAEYMMGSQVETDWQVGSPITWNGEWEGKAYQDKGEILEVEPGKRLSVTHFSPLTGAEDTPENYHTIVYELAENDGGTRLSLEQDNNGSDEEAQHSAQTWSQMLAGLKQVAESN